MLKGRSLLRTMFGRSFVTGVEIITKDRKETQLLLITQQLQCPLNSNSSQICALVLPLKQNTKS